MNLFAHTSTHLGDAEIEEIEMAAERFDASVQARAADRAERRRRARAENRAA